MSRMTSQISRRAIFDVWLTRPKQSRMDALLSYVLHELGDHSFPDDIVNSLKVTIRSVCQKIEQKWVKSGRHRERFLNNNTTWLNEFVSFSNIVEQAMPSSSQANTSNRPGRPKKSFQSSSSKTKMRRIKELAETVTEKELTMAAEVQLRKAGKRDSANIIKELCNASPKRGTTIKRARKAFASPKRARLSPDQALALIVDANLSTHQYNVIRGQIKTIDCKMYPPYYKVKEAKSLCYPTDITVTEISAEIKLQSLIDHTLIRLCKVQEEVMESLHGTVKKLNIIVKWGCDGSEQAKYKQKFSEVQNSDDSLFSISMVPIQMFSCDDHNIKNIIWQNPSTSSTRYCRPIKFIFAKETVNVIKTEVEKVKNDVASLNTTKVVINNREFLIKPIFIFCMIDGKICNAVSSCASTQTCYLCHAKPREMNNERLILQKSVDTNYLSLGLSPLHSWIRFFECILHISYRLDIKSWQVRGTENKNKMAQKKKLVQDMFRSQLGLLVDMPKQQAGNTNDGNTARKFFRNAEKSAQITGVNLELIKRFHIILECINCGFPVNIDKFGDFTEETRQLYIREYPWYSMPVSVHKILFHGKEIISSCIIPIGQLSEEAQEARNKHNKKYRELFTRKTSRIDTNIDLLNRLLITSDPLIASLRAPPKTKRGQLTREVCELLKDTTPFNESDEDSD